MSLQAHEVSMMLSVTGEACQPSPKSPWSGWLGRGFLWRLSWTSLLLNMSLEFLATIWKSVSKVLYVIHVQSVWTSVSMPTAVLPEGLCTLLGQLTTNPHHLECHHPKFSFWTSIVGFCCH